MLIEEEERKLNELMGDHYRAYGDVEYHDENVQSNSEYDQMMPQSTLKRTNSGNHLISPTQNRLNKKTLAVATTRLYEDSSRRA